MNKEKLIRLFDKFIDRSERRKEDADKREDYQDMLFYKGQKDMAEEIKVMVKEQIEEAKINTEEVKIPERNPHDIGNGEYEVYYKDPVKGKAAKFKGICENFNTTGLNAFWNDEKQQMMLVEYTDILGLYPVEINK